MLALVVAWVFVRTNAGDGLQRFAFLALALPLLGSPATFTDKLNTLKDLFGELDSCI